MRFTALALTIFTLFFASPSTVQAQSSQQLEITRATLVADVTAIEAGRPLSLGVLLEPKRGWHSYWENPGDAGLATNISWELPEGFSASTIQWPAPERIDEGPLTVYGYHDTVFLPVTITVPDDLALGSSASFIANASWLICKDICIPESATLELTLPVGNPTSSMHVSYFRNHERTSPDKLDKTFSYNADSGHIILSAPLDELQVRGVTKAHFFMRQMNVVNYATPPAYELQNNMITMQLEAATETPPDDISGILYIEDSDGQTRHYDLTFNKGESAALKTPPASVPQKDTVFFPYILLAAMLGGIILNLMPCVLPVLSLKALTLVKKGQSEPRIARAHGIAYTVGILLSFALLAGFLIALQQAGEAVGWGYQMQSPIFVGALVYLLFLVGLNLSGMFELPVLLGGTGSTLANENTTRGSFFTGVLATAVATPCTAPFMASAIGVALTMPSWQAMLIFLGLGLGLALPFLLVSFFPALLRFLPKPGAWMESFKQLLAFPMYASVIWLLWVLTLQTGGSGIVLVLSGMLLIVLALWMKRLFSKPSTYRAWAAIVIGAAIVCSLQMIGKLEPMPNQTALRAEEHSVITVDYSPQTLADMRKNGRAVFLDATAAWCITCQVNAKTAIHTERVMQAFAEQDITLMIADWTRPDPDIKALLNSFGYQGVPLYVYYPANGGEPKVLPQILTPNIIIESIN